ncbi:TMEM43 family protein [bacterium]|nr:TMEM43 family protein [bacterium]
MKPATSVIFGTLFIPFALLILFYSETAPEYGKIMNSAINLSTDKPTEPSFKKSFWISGTITASKPAVDENFLPHTSIANYPPLYLKRSAQIYAWQQKTLKNPPKQLEDYQYTTEWFSDNVPNSSTFFIKDGHQNPSSPFKSTQIFLGQDIRVGNIPLLIEPDQLFSLQIAQTLPFTLSPSMINKVAPDNSNLFIGSDLVTLYKSNSAQSESQAFTVGDLKFTYESFPLNKQVTVMGAWDGSSLVPLCLSKIRPCHISIYPGSKTEMQRWLTQADTAMFYAGRFFSFLFLWLAFYLLAKPFRHVFEVVPFFGKIAHTALGVLCFIFSLICVVLAVLFIKLFWLIVVGFIGLLVALYYIYRPKA